jgi:hypothetical protein
MTRAALILRDTAAVLLVAAIYGGAIGLWLRAMP